MIREDDSISREEVLQMIDNIREAGGFIGFNTYSEAFDQVNNMSSAPRWIPVSERLPKVNQRVLVTSYGRVCYAMMISADGNSGHPVFKLQDSLNEKVVCETTVHNIFTTSRITAWMPLPKPYKAESEEVEIKGGLKNEHLQ